jgi:transcriptional regulator with XRE-family HTH domain
MTNLIDELDDLVSDDASHIEYKHELAISSFTNDIARRMREQGVSQADLARRLGVSRARVSQLLQHASSPTLRTMVEVAHALGCETAVSIPPCGFRAVHLFVADGGKTFAGYSRATEREGVYAGQRPAAGVAA